ncbi:hypothetical protein ACIBIZ_31580 [Nonomuraea spiralis]|uniref:hypothetical protein n=1 Tax=Nonomuraea spiralis TaxID=46182 RepID=UPI0037A2BE96
MSTPDNPDDPLYELRIEVGIELTEVRRSHPETEMDLPVTDWLFDPADAEREEIGLRGLLDAVEVLEEAARPGDPPARPVRYPPSTSPSTSPPTSPPT